MMLKRLPQMIQPKEHKRARQAARSAVRAYANDPTNQNADQVHATWQAVWKMDEVLFRGEGIGTTIAMEVPRRRPKDKR
jgi:hypothetical protein